MARYGHNSMVDKRLASRSDDASGRAGEPLGGRAGGPPSRAPDTYLPNEPEPSSSAPVSPAPEHISPWRRGGRKRGRKPNTPAWQKAKVIEQQLEMEATVKSIVLMNDAAAKPLGPTELAAAHDLKRTTVMSITRLLRSRGMIHGSQRQVARALPGKPRPAVNEQELLEGLLSTDGRRLVLSKLAQSGAEPVRVSAIRALEDMDRQSGQQVGPPEPTGDVALAERVGTMLTSVGSEVGRVAIKQALEAWRVEELAGRGRGSRAAAVDADSGGLRDDGGGGHASPLRGESPGPLDADGVEGPSREGEVQPGDDPLVEGSERAGDEPRESD